MPSEPERGARLTWSSLVFRASSHLMMPCGFLGVLFLFWYSKCRAIQLSCVCQAGVDISAPLVWTKSSLHIHPWRSDPMTGRSLPPPSFVPEFVGLMDKSVARKREMVCDFFLSFFYPQQKKSTTLYVSLFSLFSTQILCLLFIFLSSKMTSFPLPLPHQFFLCKLVSGEVIGVFSGTPSIPQLTAGSLIDGRGEKYC